MPSSGGSCKVMGRIKRLVVSSTGPCDTSFISWINAGQEHACARQSLANARMRALHCLHVTGGYTVRHTPVMRNGLYLSMT